MKDLNLTATINQENDFDFEETNSNSSLDAALFEETKKSDSNLKEDSIATSKTSLDISKSSISMREDTIKNESSKSEVEDDDDDLIQKPKINKQETGIAVDMTNDSITKAENTKLTLSKPDSIITKPDIKQTVNLPEPEKTKIVEPEKTKIAEPKIPVNPNVENANRKQISEELVKTQTQIASSNTKSKVIAFMGPKEGVGKTTLLLNLAIKWAETNRRPVLIVPLDPLARNEHSYYLDIEKKVSIAGLLKEYGVQSISAVGTLLKGRIPMSEHGVGVLTLGDNREEVSKITPKLLTSILSKLSSSFDIFLDVESSYGMHSLAFDVADKIFWVTQPLRSHLNSSILLFKEYKKSFFSLKKLAIICNCYDLPGSISSDEIEKFFRKISKDVILFLPWEDTVNENSNKRYIEILVNPDNDWSSGMDVLSEHLLDIHTEQRDWQTSVTDSEFVLAAKESWASLKGGSGNINLEDIEVSEEHSVEKKEKLSFIDELKKSIHKDVLKTLELQRIVISDNSDANDIIKNKVSGIIGVTLDKQDKLQLSTEQRTKIIGDMLDEILGLGALEKLMRDKSVTEIMVNAYDRIFIEQKGKLTLTKYKFKDNAQVVQVIKRIIAPLGRRIDESVPLVDARLKDGSRVNAIISPLAISGPSITIRRFSDKPFGPKEYFKFGTITPEYMNLLEQCVKIKKNVIISGGTGTGKTTFLNALSSYIPEDERIITVEDTAELKLAQNHWIALESRPANIEGKGEITIRDLVKNCLRMRPDRIVVGECRGSEALDMLQAMNTGHEGSLATIHANTPTDGITRLEAMCMMASGDLPINAIREMISSAVNIVLQLSRFSDGTRKVTHISEIIGQDEDRIKTHDIFVYKQTGIDDNGKVEGHFVSSGKLPTFFDEFKAHGIDMPKDFFLTKESVDPIKK